LRALTEDRPVPPDSTCRALCSPANDVLRHLAMALCRNDAALCDRLVDAIAAGAKELVPFSDLLGTCVRYSTSAPALACRPLFEAAAACFWEHPSLRAAQLLGFKFWSAADAVTGGAQAQRAIAAVAITPGRAVDVELACTAAFVLGAISQFTSADHLAEAHRVLQAASASEVRPLAEEAVFARLLLDPLPGTRDSDASLVDLRERLLRLARSPGSSASSVTRAVGELTNRYAGDADVTAALKADVRILSSGGRAPFVAACVEGPGLPLISLEIACDLFQCLEAGACTRLAMRMWDADGDVAGAVADGRTPCT